MFIVEDTETLKSFFKDYKEHPSIILPMWVDFDLHPKRLDLSFLYIRCNETDWVIPINHIDCINQSFDIVKRMLETSDQSKYVYSLKSLLYTIDISNSTDMESVVFMNRRTQLDAENSEWKAEFIPIVSFYKSLRYYRNTIKSIPILKLIEVVDSFLPQLSDIVVNDDILWYSQHYIPLLSKIEQTGIEVNRELYVREVSKMSNLTKENFVYTEYNPYTLTGRPSNRHGGINYSAMKRGTKLRDVFISGKGNHFVQFDYDSYHLRIIADLIDFPLPMTSVHQMFAEMYNSTYEESKGITFRQIYGGIEAEFLKIPFFSKTQEFIDMLWDTVNEIGYIQTKYRKIPLQWIENPDPYKVFNYMLQSLETEINVVKMEIIMDLIKDTNVDLVLYTYDSFLFKSPLDLESDIYDKIVSILEDGGYPVKRKIGYTFGEL
jgi:hypothetical protein